MTPKYEIHDLVVYNDKGTIVPAFITYININVMMYDTVVMYSLSTGECIEESDLLRVVDKEYINQLLNKEKFVEVDFEKL